jgi:hypothetical protein
LVKKKSFSASVMVFTMKRLSVLKKKKLPEAPLASPALKTFEEFFSGSRDERRISELIPSPDRSSLN